VFGSFCGTTEAHTDASILNLPSPFFLGLSLFSPPLQSYVTLCRQSLPLASTLLIFSTQPGHNMKESLFSSLSESPFYKKGFNTTSDPFVIQSRLLTSHSSFVRNRVSYSQNGPPAVQLRCLVCFFLFTSMQVAMAAARPAAFRTWSPSRHLISAVAAALFPTLCVFCQVPFFFLESPSFAFLKGLLSLFTHSPRLLGFSLSIAVYSPPYFGCCLSSPFQILSF